MAPGAEEDDEALARRAAGGERAAFEQLLRRHYERIHRLAYRLVGNSAGAEDIAQEVAIKLARGIRSFDGRSRFSTWLHRVVVNAARDEARRARGQERLDGAYAAAEIMARADGADDARRRAVAVEALAHLSGDLKETLLLVVGEGMTHARAAEVLGISEGTVSWRLHEARKRLKSVGRELIDG